MARRLPMARRVLFCAAQCHPVLLPSASPVARVVCSRDQRRFLSTQAMHALLAHSGNVAQAASYLCGAKGSLQVAPLRWSLDDDVAISRASGAPFELLKRRRG